MLRKKQNRFEWLEFELLQSFPEVKHGVFLHVDLGEKGLKQDQEEVFNLFGVSGIKLKQVHKDKILEIKKAPPQLTLHEGFDGMVTKEKGVGLLIRHADCQPAIFYDPVTQSLANVHCGWRGSALNIYKKTIDTMKRLYGVNPEDLRVCIGPSLGPKHAEFIHFRKELPKDFWSYQVTPTYFDFWAISEWQLQECGVPHDQIEVARQCTYGDPSLFSYRRTKPTPHHGTVASVKSRNVL